MHPIATRSRSSATGASSAASPARSCQHRLSPVASRPRRDPHRPGHPSHGAKRSHGRSTRARHTARSAARQRTPALDPDPVRQGHLVREPARAGWACSRNSRAPRSRSGSTCGRGRAGDRALRGVAAAPRRRQGRRAATVFLVELVLWRPVRAGQHAPGEPAAAPSGRVPAPAVPVRPPRSSPTPRATAASRR